MPKRKKQARNTQGKTQWEPLLLQMAPAIAATIADASAKHHAMLEKKLELELKFAETLLEAVKGLRELATARTKAE